MSVSHAQFVNLDPSAIAIASNVRTDAGYDLDSLASLADSIATYGVLQPVLVTRKNGGFELVAGHRRVLAAQIAGIASVPAVVQDTPAEERLARQLAENVQRADLSLLDQAQAVRALHDEHKSLAIVAEMVGKSKSWVCKMLALTADAGGSIARMLLQHDVIDDLDVAHLVTQIEKVSGTPFAEIVADEIRQGKHTRETLRKKLAMLKAEKDATAEDDDDNENDGKAQTAAKPTADQLAAALHEACELLRLVRNSVSAVQSEEIDALLTPCRALLNRAGY